jgi:hypothetical protein
MTGNYVLIGQTPVVEPDLLTWARWFEENDRRVALSRVLDIAVVSTVFLGIDHNYFRFAGYGKPLLFETMVFWEDEGGEEQDRCSTWAEAEAMHAAMVREAGAPRTYFAHLLRQARGALREARDSLREAIKELRWHSAPCDRS